MRRMEVAISPYPPERIVSMEVAISPSPREAKDEWRLLSLRPLRKKSKNGSGHLPNL